MMKEGKLFSLLPSSGVSFARRGKLEFQPRAGSTVPIKLITPALITPTAKGTVPHITPDNLDNYLFTANRIQGVHFGLEDFVENLPKVPIFGYPNNNLPSSIKSLNELFCLPDALPTVLSIRRAAFDPLNKSNTDEELILSTSKGYLRFNSKRYQSLFDTIFKSVAPEIFLSPIDLPVKTIKGIPGKNRIRSIIRRNQLWLSQFLPYHKSSSIFAPLVTSFDPTEYTSYAEFLRHNKAIIAGFAVYPGLDTNENKSINQYLEDLVSETQHIEDTVSSDLTSDVTDIIELPRYNLRPCDSPNEILGLVARGMDIFNDNISVKYAEAGVALKFQFPIPVDDDQRPPFGINIWHDRYRTDITPLNSSNLKGYNWAYVNHLFSAREMLSTILLSIHNITVMDQFFAGIRQCIKMGTFDSEYAKFREVYSGQEGPELYNEALGMMEDHRIKAYNF